MVIRRSRRVEESGNRQWLNLALKYKQTEAHAHHPSRYVTYLSASRNVNKEYSRILELLQERNIDETRFHRQMDSLRIMASARRKLFALQCLAPT